MVANGLWPMPSRGPVKATVHGRVERDDYTVDRVFLESFPGHFVTGSLYRPKDTPGKLPVVLSPHGHYANGRFHDHGEDEVRRQQEMGAEKFSVGGRHPLQARCVHLARMGCIVFLYDMVGYADSVQIPYSLAHRQHDARPKLQSTDAWGFFTAQAEMRCQNILGLQTYNSIRALDWLTSLPYVDTHRVAVTGSSGGGTQTMMISAIDDRVKVSFPAVMVSTAMQGGCTCENATCLRVGTGNIEFAAMFAPRPLGMTAADDWTKEIATKGFPDLKRLYKTLGAPDGVAAYPLVRFPHNFNYVSRSKMYAWLNEHLELGHDPVPVETDYRPLSRAEATVWTGEHAAPQSGVAYETELLRDWHIASERQLAELKDDERDQLVRDAMQVIVGDNATVDQTIERKNIAKIERSSYWEFHDLLRNANNGSELPTVFLYPKTEWNSDVVLWLNSDGKSSIFGRNETPIAAVRGLLESGYAVASVDLLFQGEFIANGEPPTETRKVANPRDFAGYTFGYNATLLANRVQDVLTLVSFIRGYDQHPIEDIHLAALGSTGPVAVVARALAGDALSRTAIYTGGFEFAQIQSWRHPNFFPGAIKYGDMQGILKASSSSAPLLLANKLADIEQTFSGWIINPTP